MHGPTRSPARTLFWLAPLCIACLSTAPSPPPAGPAPPAYRPGRSITEARLCECRECFSRDHCEGEALDTEQKSGELGMTLAGPGRCVRRIWTLRGAGSCSDRPPRECCPGTIGS